MSHSLLKALPRIALLGSLIATGVMAEKSPEFSKPAEPGRIEFDREAVRARRHRLRDILENMSDDGSEKTPGAGTIEEDSPAAKKKGPKAPRAPGRIDLNRLGDFVRQVMERSHNQSFKDGYNILTRGVDDIFRLGSLPPAMEVLLRGAKRGADKASSYDDGWECMYEALKAISENPHAFAAGGWQTFTHMMRMTRRLTTEKSWKNGYQIALAYLREVRGRRTLFVDSMHDLALEAAMRSADKAGSYSDGYKVLVFSSQALAQANSNQPGRGFFQAAMAGPQNDMTFKNAYLTLMTFARAYRNSGDADQFDRVTLEGAIRDADRASSYDDGYRILWQAFQNLAR